MDFNPIVVKELRSRWRGRAFILLAAYVLLLAGTVVFTYESSGHYMSQQEWDSNGPKFGHDLFVAFSYMEVLGWLLIGPALTATSISGEREMGLLESLQMSPLRPARIVWGKLASVLLFIALMQLTALPITATCFLMGGVSGGEFTRAFFLQFVTATCCAATGIYFSSVLRRSQTSVAVTFCAVLGWALGSFFALVWSAGAAPAGAAAPGDELISNGATLFGLTNPIMAMAAVVDPRSYPFASSAITGLFRDPVDVSIGFQALVAVLLMGLAARAVAKPLPDPQLTRRGSLRQIASSPYPDAYFHLPMVSDWKSANPILQRELRAKFRWKRMPRWLSGILVTALASGLWWYAYEITEILTNQQNRAEVWGIVSILGAIAGMIAAALLGAAGFAREREANTWEALELSQLIPGEIIHAKLAAILTGLAVYSIPLWPLLILCLGSDDDTNRLYSGLPIERALMAGASIIATLWWVSAYSLYLSWFFKRTAPAIGWALGSLTFAMTVLPFMLAMLLSGSAGIHGMDVLVVTHPLIQIAVTLDKYSFDQSGFAAAFGILASIAAGWIWIGMLHAKMNRDPNYWVPEMRSG